MNKTSVVSITLFITILLVGCSHFTTSTNLDSSNFDSYFSASHVIIYNDEKEFKSTYQYVGLVEGEDCQQKAHYAKPDEIIARTNARKHADEIKANAIIFTGCAIIDNDQSAKQCLATTVCYGKAYFVNP